MRYLKNREDFLFSINESMFYISQDFRKKLNDIDSPIADALLSVVLTDVKPDMTFIDVADKEGYVKFSQISNVVKGIGKKEYVDEETGEVQIADYEKGAFVDKDGNKRGDFIKNLNIDHLLDDVKGRNQVKVGKLVNKIFPGKFKDSEVEDFVNKFKAKSSKEQNIEIVKGDDIAYWYHCDNYADNVGGSLGSSCMRSMDDEVFEIYTDNPDVCRMLILKNENDKLIARALVWKVQFKPYYLRMNPALNDVTYFMDRVYASEDSDIQKFIDFAKSKGWAHKTHQNYHTHQSITFKGENYNVEMYVEVGADYYHNYPYMDTFATFDENGTLYNTEDASSKGGILLQDTGGGHLNSGIWSDYHGDYIPEEDAVYSEPLGDHILADEAVRVETVTHWGHEGFYPQDSDEVVYVSNIGEYIHIDDAEYSDYDGETYFVENTSSAIIDVDDFGAIDSQSMVSNDDNDFLDIYDLEDEEWFKLIDSENYWSDHQKILDSLMTQDYEGNDIPKILAIETFNVDGEWLSKYDSILLKSKADMSGYEERTENKFEYFERVWLNDRNPFTVIENLKAKIDGKEVGQLEIDFKDLDSKKRKSILNAAIYELEDLIEFYSNFHDDKISKAYVISEYGNVSKQELKSIMDNIVKEFWNKWTKGEIIGSKVKNEYDAGSEEKITLLDQALIELRGYASSDSKVNDMEDEELVEQLKNYLFGYVIPKEVKKPSIRNYSKPNNDDLKEIIKEVSDYLGKEIGELDILGGISLLRYHENKNPHGYTTSNILNSLKSYKDFYRLADYYREMGSVNEGRIMSFSEYKNVN